MLMDKTKKIYIASKCISPVMLKTRFNLFSADSDAQEAAEPFHLLDRDEDEDELPDI